jgi:hypothetical protein
MYSITGLKQSLLIRENLLLLGKKDLTFRVGLLHKHTGLEVIS